MDTPMITINQISDQTFLRARELSLPVNITGPASFILPSATRPAFTEHHQVRFDSSTEPTAFACSCEAYRNNRPCWAAARALLILQLLAVNGVTLSFTLAAPDAGGVRGALPPASFCRDGRVDHVVAFDGPMPHLGLDRSTEAVEERAVLVPQIRRVGRLDKVGGFTI
jgi:hypothetical protein